MPRRLYVAMACVVVLIDVKSQPADIRFGLGERADVIVHRTEDAPAAGTRMDVHALDPPEDAVTQVAPFIRDHRLADDLGADLGDKYGTARAEPRCGSTPSVSTAGSSSFDSVSTANWRLNSTIVRTSSIVASRMSILTVTC